jgi:hypothetical protein
MTMPWRPASPRGNVTGQILGDPLPDRLERAEALRLSLPPPRDDERGDLKGEPDPLTQAIRTGAGAVASYFGLVHGEAGWG